MYIFSSYANEKSIGLFVNEKDKIKNVSSCNVISPSFCVSGDGYIYSYERKDKMILKSFKVNKNLIEAIDTFEIGGTHITHLVYSKIHKVLYGCSYQDGSYFAIRVLNGRFKEVLNFQKQIEDDRLSRCHCVFLDKNEETLGIVNIALDAIYLYDITNDYIVYKDIINLPKESGPRHAIFNNDSSFIYVVTEYSNEVFVIDYKSKTLIQRISTTSFDKETYGATLLMNKNETKLYASNRGDESIVEFSVINHKLEYVKNFNVFGKHSRHMIITKDDKYIISCNMNSNNITFINLLTYNKDFEVKMDAPSCAIDMSTL